MNSTPSNYRPPLTVNDLAKLSTNSFGQLVAKLNDGTEYVDVQPVRGFPLSQPDFGVSLMNEHGVEILWIERLGDCPTDVQKIIRDDLARGDFLPIISRVYSISSDHEPCEWDVQTDRGRVKFVLKNDEDVRRVDANRAIITDAHRVEYLVVDKKSMDPVSKRYIERYL